MMTNFKIGDRVIFLNEKGGGIISKVVDEQIVHVSVEDGFEIPYATKDLLRSAGADQSALGIGIAAEEAIDNPDMKPLYYIHNKPDQLREGVYMAFVPNDQEQLLNSKLDIIMINRSPYQLLYSIYQNRSGTFHGIDFGYIDPESLLSLSSIDRTGIEDWANGIVQLVFYMEGKAIPLNPASAIISFKPVKVYKEDSFRYEGLLRKNAMVIELTTTDKQAQKLIADEWDENDIERLKETINEGHIKKPPASKAESYLDKHKVDDKIAEVDLHIGELVADYSRMSNVEMLNIQMDYFRRCMEAGRSEKLTKIIFIHGVGNGTLKNELSRYLRQTEGIEFYDAPYARYGMGATEVLFYKHR